jgi:hypothetical protein
MFEMRIPGRILAVGILIMIRKFSLHLVIAFLKIHLQFWIILDHFGSLWLGVDSPENGPSKSVIEIHFLEAVPLGSARGCLIVLQRKMRA